MENDHGSDRQPSEAEKEKAEEKKPPQVEPQGNTGDPATPPDPD